MITMSRNFYDYEQARRRFDSSSLIYAGHDINKSVNIILRPAVLFVLDRRKHTTLEGLVGLSMTRLCL